MGGTLQWTPLVIGDFICVGLFGIILTLFIMKNRAGKDAGKDEGKVEPPLYIYISYLLYMVGILIRGISWLLVNEYLHRLIQVFNAGFFIFLACWLEILRSGKVKVHVMMVHTAFNVLAVVISWLPNSLISMYSSALGCSIFQWAGLWPVFSGLTGMLICIELFYIFVGCIRKKPQDRKKILMRIFKLFIILIPVGSLTLIYPETYDLHPAFIWIVAIASSVMLPIALGYLANLLVSPMLRLTGAT
ncbi:MAG: hypothetical protein ACFFCS_16765 [Candidatus Hodarchaeota archaeon]